MVVWRQNNRPSATRDTDRANWRLLLFRESVLRFSHSYYRKRSACWSTLLW